MGGGYTNYEWFYLTIGIYWNFSEVELIYYYLANNVVKGEVICVYIIYCWTCGGAYWVCGINTWFEIGENSNLLGIEGLTTDLSSCY